MPRLPADWPLRRKAEIRFPLCVLNVCLVKPGGAHAAAALHHALPSAKSGSWLYGVERREPGDLDGQIEELFGALTADLSVWRPLAENKPDLFVSLFMKESNEGIKVSARCMQILAARGVSLSLDIYGPLEK